MEDLKGQAAAGFFPLYPLTVGLMLKVVPSLSFFWVATIFSNVVDVRRALARRRAPKPTAALARRVLLVICAAAGSFYLSIPYAESLFLLLVVLTLIRRAGRCTCWRRSAAGLAFATRVSWPGRAGRAGRRVLARRAPARRSTRTRDRADRGVFAIPMGIHMAYLADVQGSAEAFIARQAMWDNAWPYPLKAIVGLSSSRSGRRAGCTACSGSSTSG